MKRYDKLVRDKIPEICEADGVIPTIRIVENDAEYLRMLTAKLVEEATEVQEAPSLEELADALEVIQSIGRALGHATEEIEAARAQKAEERGSFASRVFLISTEPKE